MLTNLDDSLCPLCGQSNRCDVQAQQGCWCMKVKVPTALLGKVPDSFKGTICICNACIERFQQQKLSKNSNNIKEQ